MPLKDLFSLALALAWLFDPVFKMGGRDFSLGHSLLAGWVERTILRVAGERAKTGGRGSGVRMLSRMVRYGVWLVNYGDNSMNHELVIWADRELTTRRSGTQARLMWALDDELQRRGIEIPFPQRDLHIRSGTLNVRMQGAADAAD